MPEWTNPQDATTPAKPLASWYAQGLSDGLGDRLLMFDNSTAPSLELLRFRPDLALIPGFEEALREQVQRLAQFRHPAFARVRAVQRLEPDDDLALISNCTPGKRLSEVLHRARGANFASAVVQQLAPALVLFQQHGDGLAHGALNPDRIIVTPDGQFTIVEHVVGPAINALGLKNGQLAALGIALPPAPDGSSARLDVATDWYQLGLVAMSALLGRQMTAADLPQLRQLLDADRDGTVLSPWIRQLLDHALQFSGTRIESGADARAALDQMLEGEQSGGARRLQPAAAEPASGLAAFNAERVPVENVLAGPASVAPVPVTKTAPAAPPVLTTPAPAPSVPPVLTQAPGSEPTTPPVAPRPPASPVMTQPQAPAPVRAPSAPVVHAQAPPPARTPSVAVPPARTPSSPGAPTDFRPEPVAQAPARPSPPLAKAKPAAPRTANAPVARPVVREARPAVQARPAQPAIQPRPAATPPQGFSTMVVAALVLIVVLQAGVIGLMGRALWFAAPPAIAVQTAPSGEKVLVSSKPAESNPMRLSAAPDLSWISVTSPSIAGVVGAKAPSTKTGIVRISSPISLKVVENSRSIGSVPGGDLRLTPGRHEIELVNAALGYRLQQSVQVEAGQTVSIHVAPANGWATIYAVPSAEVSIDGKEVGRTPLGPLPLALGDHTVTFTHPTGASDRQRISVQSGETIRVIGNPRR